MSCCESVPHYYLLLAYCHMSVGRCSRFYGKCGFHSALWRPSASFRFMEYENESAVPMEKWNQTVSQLKPVILSFMAKLLHGQLVIQWKHQWEECFQERHLGWTGRVNWQINGVKWIIERIWFQYASVKCSREGGWTLNILNNK